MEPPSKMRTLTLTGIWITLAIAMVTAKNVQKCIEKSEICAFEVDLCPEKHIVVSRQVGGGILYKCTTAVGAYVCFGRCTSWWYVFQHSQPEGYKRTISQTERWSVLKPRGRRNNVIVTIRNVKKEDELRIWVCSDEYGKDICEEVNIIVQPASTPTAAAPKVPEPEAKQDQTIVKTISLKDLKDTVALETGFRDYNAWLEWVSYTVRSQNRKDCYACAAARGQLIPVPFPLNFTNSPQGITCMISLYTTRNKPTNANCSDLHYLFPPVTDRVPPPFMVPKGGNFSCFTRIETTAKKATVGEIQGCAEVINLSNTNGAKKLLPSFNKTWMTSHEVGRADVWWYCGGKIIRPKLPHNWEGRCAMIKLLMPFSIITLHGEQTAKSDHTKIMKRMKRAIEPKGNFDPHIYIDSIGVPRGVPDEYKARNQIAAGFESILFWWSTTNKNVDWINYLYYNQQRFINYTRDAIKGLAEQLDRTSLMAWQNRMALDMLLAEKGGVCVMFGSSCCTFIPNNTAPDGSVTKALEGLTSLASELAENSGVDTSWTSFLDNWFGKWKNVFISAFTSIIIIVGVLVTCGCCIIPCARGMTSKLIETALTKKEQMMYEVMLSKIDHDDEVELRNTFLP